MKDLAEKLNNGAKLSDEDMDALRNKLKNYKLNFFK